MTKARIIADVFNDANTADNLVQLDGSSRLPAVNASQLTNLNIIYPTISGISPSTVTNVATDIVITGTNFVITPSVEFISTTGAIITPNSVTQNSVTQLTANVTIPTDGTYFTRVELPSGLAVRTSTASLTVSDAPVWQTSSGSLGSIAKGGTANFTISATSDSTVAYSIASGSLPTGVSLNTSTGAITGTESSSITSETVYNFTARATDLESQSPADRSFSITVTVGATGGGQFN